MAFNSILIYFKFTKRYNITIKYLKLFYHIVLYKKHFPRFSIKNLYEHFPYKSPGFHCCNYSKNPDNSAVAASDVCILAEDPLTVVEDDNDLHDEQFDLEKAAEVVELLHICPLGVESAVPEVAGD